MATAGFLPPVMHPTVYIGPLDPNTGFGPFWPSKLATKGQVWPTTHPVFTGAGQGWQRWWGMQNGLVFTINDPQVAIGSSDRGMLGMVSTGAHGIQVASISQTPTRKFVEWLNKLGKVTSVAVGGTAEVRTLTLTGTATAAGNAVIVLDNQVYSVPLASGDTATVAAGKIGTAINYTPVLAGWTPSSATSVVTYTATSPGAHTGLFQANLPAGLTGAFATTTPGVAPTFDAGDVMFFDPNGAYGSIQRFTLGVEAIAPAGSWADSALLVRAIVHSLNPGGNRPIRFDDTGNDANTRADLSAQAEPRAVSALEQLGGGWNTATDQDPYGKMSWWVAALR